MSRVLLVTCDEWPDGEPGGVELVQALAGRGVEGLWAVWDDDSVDWAAADLVAVRSTWDHQQRAEEFLAWARAVDRTNRLLNGAEAFAWNLDKSNLMPLADDVPEFQVHEEYGGRAVAVPLDDTQGSLAEAAVRSTAVRLGADLDYARVDLLSGEGRWVVSELELIEPGFYLDVDPADADRFADLVVSLL